MPFLKFLLAFFALILPFSSFNNQVFAEECNVEILYDPGHPCSDSGESTPSTNANNQSSSRINESSGNNQNSREKTPGNRETSGAFYSEKLELFESNSKGHGYDKILLSNKVKDIVDDSVDDESGNSSLAIRHLFYDKQGNVSNVIVTINKFIGTLAILWLVILGIKFIFAQGAEDDMSKYKRQFGWILLGLATVSIAEFVAFQVLDPNEELLGAAGAASINAFEAKVSQIKRFLQILAAGLALLSMIRSGYNLITTPESGEDDTIAKEKEFIKAFLFAVIFIILSEVLVRFVFFADGGNSMNAQAGIMQFVGFINFLLSFVAGAAVFMLILASLYYLTSFGDDDRTNKAKQIIISCIIALIIVVMSYTLTRFLI